jgi:N-methylhydantoinase B
MGTDQYGGPFAAVLQECCLAAGSAAGEVSDGIDTGGVTEPEVSIPNVENNEFRYPVLYLHRRQRRDSGGAGKFRGGVGLSMAFTPHDVDEIPNVMIHTHGVSSPSALGLAGGYPAVLNHLAIKRKSNIAELFKRGEMPAEVTDVQGDAIELPPPFTYTRLKKGDVFECAGGGGGGYGDPIDRAPEAVVRDVKNGLVSPEAAKTHYGVVLDSKNQADVAGTAQQRTTMRRARQDTSRVISNAAVGLLGNGMSCRCGQSLGKLSARDITYEAQAYTEKKKVHTASYVIKEAFCPSCWTVVETRISVPQVEA